MGRLIDEVRPDTILTFGPDGMTFHPDHVAVHHWVTTAWERRDRPGRLLYSALTSEHLDDFGALYEEWDVYMSELRPVGLPVDRLAVHLALEGDALDRKLTALRAMATQTAGAVATLGLDRYIRQIAEESFAAAPEAATAG